MDEISSLDWDIVPKDGWEYDWVADAIDEVKEFLKNPNKNNEPFEALIRALLKDILEIDAGTIVKVFDVNSYDFNQIEPKSGAPLLKPLGQRKMTELYVRDGASFLKEIDKFGFLKGFWQYSYQIPAHPMWFHRDEIIYISEHPRSMSCYGYARTQAILDIIKSLHYSTLYNKRFFEETPIPDGALSLLDTNDMEMKAFLNWWNGEFKAQPHKLAVINKDIKWQPFAVTNRELEFLETQKWYFNVVISMFGLTPAELGITDDLNRATSATQAELVKRKGIRPFLKLLENFINAGIIPEFQYEGIEFQFIYDDPAEKKARLENWKMELDMGVKTPNEVREEMGLEPVEGGDVANTQANRFSVGQPGGQEEGGNPIEGGQSGGYKETLDREEGKNQPASKSLKEETDEEVREAILKPYGDSNRATGNFKGVKYREMPYKDLIAEHKELVRILQSGTAGEKKDLLEEQKKELEEYIRDFEANVKKKFTKSETVEFNGERGHWVTSRGRHLFITEGGKTLGSDGKPAKDTAQDEEKPKDEEPKETEKPKEETKPAEEAGPRGTHDTKVAETLHGYSKHHEEVLSDLKSTFKDMNVYGRLKTADSIAGKLERKPDQYKSIDDLRDVSAMRIETNDVHKIMDVVERLREKYHVADEKDYLSKPEAGYYRSYHVIIKKDGKYTEVQVRTPNMTRFSDYLHDRVYKPPKEKQQMLFENHEKVSEYVKSLSDYYWGLDNGQNPEKPVPDKKVLECLGEAL